MDKQILTLLEHLESDFSAYIRGTDTLTEEVRDLKNKVETLIAHSPLTNTKMQDIVHDATSDVVEVLREDIKKVDKRVGEL